MAERELLGSWIGAGLEIAYREALPRDPEGAPVALFLHGYPNSSYLWRAVLPVAAAAGFRAIAPDLPGYGDSPPVRPATWERMVEVVEAFRTGLGLGRVVLGVHDWGGLIGLRWACDHPDAVAALVISDTGFFPDGRWHGMAQALQTPGEGEQLVENTTRELLGMVMANESPAMPADAVDEYFKAWGDPERRGAQLDLYRSGDFAKLEPYEGRLAGLGVPVLVLWGDKDAYAPVGAAHRFGRIPGARLTILEEAGHFLMEDDPPAFAAAVRAFLEEQR